MQIIILNILLILAIKNAVLVVLDEILSKGNMYVKPKRHCDSRYSIISDKEALFVVAKQLTFITKR
jgi:hypothetical protein